MPLDHEFQTEIFGLHETWIVEDCEKYQHVENLNWHPFVGDIGDGRFSLKVV